jgi:hyperosmotically inducible protein
MRSDLFSAVSLSALLLACAHDKGSRSEHAQAEARAQHHAASDQDGVDSDGDGRDHDRVAQHEDRDHDGVDSDGDGQDRDRVAVPERTEKDRGRLATAGDELPRNERANRENTAAEPREGTELNALDQGNSEIDIDLTQRIRKAVMDDDTLSFKAKNVKIITRDGHVTLRGEVKTAAEKAAIAKTAIGAAGVAHVTNQIEVRE